LPTPIFTHLMGTLALLSVLVILTGIFTAVFFFSQLTVQRIRVTEVAESVARELVELASVHTLGGGPLTYMYITVPPTIYGQAYNITLQQAGEGKILVTVSLQLYREVRVVVVPNFGKCRIKVVNGTLEVGDLKISRSILLPLPEVSIDGRRIRGRPILVAVTQGDTVLIGFSAKWG